MTRLTDLEYLQLNRFSKIWYKLRVGIVAIPHKLANFFKKIWKAILRFVFSIRDWFVSVGTTFVKGNWVTKVSYFIWGFGSIWRKQYLRGILLFLAEVLFIFYMSMWGHVFLHKMFYQGHIGEIDVIYTYVNKPGVGKVRQEQRVDDSVTILLMGLLTFGFIISAFYTWCINIKQNRIAEEILASGKKLKSTKDDLKSLLDDQFHKTLLALPVTGITLFTVFPTIFMIVVAFTNYDAAHNGWNAFIDWVGFDNFKNLVVWTEGTTNLRAQFGHILLWTLVWAFFATFSNYFLGMLVAMMINKKGIKLKKLWRGVLVLSSAVPQFISLMYIHNLFSDTGLINTMLKNMGFFQNQSVDHIGFWTDSSKPIYAQVMVIVINIWIGIPYLMLITSGVLMNIPADLYESARIDGANAWQQLVRITVPYMLFVTGPYLLTSFTGNLNNFNVIYLLSGGGPTNLQLSGSEAVGDTDLLITWIFKLAIGQTNDYKTASVIGIMIFIVVSFLSLVVYNLLPSNKNEEDFS